MNDLERLEVWSIQNAIYNWSALAWCALFVALATVALAIYLVSAWLFVASACMFGVWLCCVVKLFRLKTRLSQL
jgi:hypothetical protein